MADMINLEVNVRLPEGRLNDVDQQRVLDALADAVYKSVSGIVKAGVSNVGEITISGESSNTNPEISRSDTSVIKFDSSYRCVSNYPSLDINQENPFGNIPLR